MSKYELLKSVVERLAWEVMNLKEKNGSAVSFGGHNIREWQQHHRLWDTRRSEWRRLKGWECGVPNEVRDLRQTRSRS